MECIIEHVCPKAKKPVKSKLLESGTKSEKVWENTGTGLYGEVTKKWKSIIVQCSYCGEKHEYALTMHPLNP